MKKKRLIKILHASIIFVLLLLVILFIFRAHRHYAILKNHREYFRQPNPEIEPWMTVHTLIRHYNLSNEVMYRELGINGTTLNKRLTVESICKKNHLNCTGALIRLNAIKQHG